MSMNQVNQRMFKNKQNIEYYTDPNTWENILKYIPADKPLWCPFYNEKFPKSLRTINKFKKLGYNVLENKPDFFTYSHPNAVVIDNPPFNLKKKIILKLIEYKNPFILLLPTTIIDTQYVKDLCVNNDDFQFIIPRKRIKFDTSTLKQTQIHTIYFCYKMNLDKRIIFN